MIDVPDRKYPPDIFDICLLVALYESKNRHLTISEIYQRVNKIIEMTRIAVSRRIERLVKWGFAAKKMEINMYYVKITDNGCKYLANILLHILERITLVHLLQHLIERY